MPVCWLVIPPLPWGFNLIQAGLKNTNLSALLGKLYDGLFTLTNKLIYKILLSCLVDFKLKIFLFKLINPIRNFCRVMSRLVATCLVMSCRVGRWRITHRANKLATFAKIFHTLGQ